MSVDKFNKLILSLGSGWFAEILSPLCGVYSAFLGYQISLEPANRLWFIDTHKTTLSIIFYVAIALPPVTLLLVSLIRRCCPLSTPEDTLRVMSAHAQKVSAIVAEKAERFRRAAGNFVNDSHGKKFTAITQPELQIEFIGRMIQQFLKSEYGVPEESIDVTVAHEIDHGKWEYLLLLQKNWERIPASELARTKSALAKCLETGEVFFCPSKIHAETQQNYLLSKRDKRIGGDGSVFVFPIQIQTYNRKIRYVVSIVTYGAVLCRVGDQDASKITKSFLIDFCRRIELELLLYTIRNKINQNRNTRASPKNSISSQNPA